MRVVDPDSSPAGFDERWLWRQALLIVGQLPEQEEAANAVLMFAMKLLREAPKRA